MENRTVKKVFLFVLFPILLFSQTYTIKDSTMTSITVGNGDVLVGFTGRNYVMAKHRAKSNYTIDRVALRLQKDTGESPTMDIVAQVWSHTIASNEPDVQLSVNSSAVNASTLPVAESAEWINFDFSTGVTVTADDTVWIGVYTATTSGTNQAEWEFYVSHAGTMKYDADGLGTWTLVLNSVADMRIYEKDEVITDDSNTFNKFNGFNKW